MMSKQLILIFLYFWTNALVYAHESRPFFIKIVEDSLHLAFEINLPNTVDARNLPEIYLNEKHLNQAAQWVKYTAGFRQKWRLPKENTVLKGAKLTINYPVFNPVLSSIIALHFKDNTERVLLMPPNKKELLIPQDAKAFEVQKQYAMLGIEHIWVGIDHLLFVLCLLIITGFNRKLFWTITGFTIAHSITLVLSALKIIQLPIPPIEATIALSIVFLCYEIIHHHANKDSLTYRYPILVSSSFGLLHGLGFAAVLGEIGLPQTHRATALLFFNIGVEIGQILFIICLWILFYGLKKLFEVLFKQQKQQRVLQLGFRMVIYVVGILASYWMFDRIF